MEYYYNFKNNIFHSTILILIYSIITSLSYNYCISIYIHTETKTGENVVILTILIIMTWNRGECKFSLSLYVVSEISTIRP